MFPFLTFTDEELAHIAYALECRFGFSDELAERIYQHLEDKTGKDYRL